MAKVLVAYASQHGSTEEIAKEIANEIKEDVEVKSVETIKSIKDYDFLVLGTPIYNDYPMQEMKDFIWENKYDIAEKNKAIFVVTSDVESNEKAKRSLIPFRNIVPGEVIAEKVFSGEMDLDELSNVERQSVDEYLSSINEEVKSYSKIDYNECKKFGQIINKLI